MPRRSKEIASGKRQFLKAFVPVVGPILSAKDAGTWNPSHWDSAGKFGVISNLAYFGGPIAIDSLGKLSNQQQAPSDDVAKNSLQFSEQARVEQNGISSFNRETSTLEAFPILQTLELRESEIIRIGDTNLEVLNFSESKANFEAIEQIYRYVNGVANQFVENGWYYPSVNTSYQSQQHQFDIYIRPSIAERRGLVLLPPNMEIPGLNMPDVAGASIYQPFEITFLRLPTPVSPGLAEAVPGYTQAVSNIHAMTVEACQSSIYVSSPQDTVPRSSIGHEVFCNSIGWHTALSQTGMSVGQVADFLAPLKFDAAGIIFNPIPPDPLLYSQIPTINDPLD